MSLLPDLFTSSEFSAHGFCLSWNPDLMALHVVSDAAIGLSYFSIPLVFLSFLLRRRDLALPWAFWLFVVFIVACGATHFMAIWTLWHPDYAAEGVVKAVTAIGSVLTAVQLWPLLPKAVALPSPEMLRAANAELQARIVERDQVVQALRLETAERLRTEAILARAQKMEAVGQLTGGIAHDFNNLLMVVMANLELLAKRVCDQPPLLKYVDRAIGSAARGAALIQQLLAFARRQPLHPVTFDPGRLVENTATLLQGLLGPGVSLSLQRPADLWHVEADPNQLESALLNLAINARDAMPDGGEMTVRTANMVLDPVKADALDAAPGDYVVISVSDTGIGMSREIRESAFEPFFTTKAIGQGSGLGLSQVYGFIKQSQGHVSLRSEPGLGTTVSLYLRRSAPPQVHPEVTLAGEEQGLRDNGPEAFAYG